LVSFSCDQPVELKASTSEMVGSLELIR